MNREVCPACGRAKPGPKPQPKRDARILRLYQRGWTYEGIAVECGISRQRVAQIVKENEGTTE